jgi:hypothetical protein
MKMHKSITPDRVVDAVGRRMFSLDNPGFCIACGEDAEGCEPDMRRGKCEHCGKRAVYGVYEILLEIAL